MLQQKVGDLEHYEHQGQVEDVTMRKGQSLISYRQAGGKTHTGIPIMNFGMGQVLKFADLKKSEARDMDSEEIIGQLGGKEVVFKRTDEKVLAVVSPDFKNIETNHIHHTLKNHLEEQGVSFGDIDQHRGLVTRVWYTLDGVDSFYGLDPGLYLRNSVFGASALGMGRFYRIQDNNAKLMLTNRRTYKKYHVGDDVLVHDEIRQHADEFIDHMWDDIKRVQESRDRHFEKDKQVEVVLDYRDRNKITKEMAGKLVSHIDHETWGSEKETLWSFIKTICGYAEHGNLSQQNRKKLFTMAEEVFEAHNKQLVHS